MKLTTAMYRFNFKQLNILLTILFFRYNGNTKKGSLSLKKYAGNGKRHAAQICSKALLYSTMEIYRPIISIYLRFSV